MKRSKGTERCCTRSAYQSGKLSFLTSIKVNPGTILVAPPSDLLHLACERALKNTQPRTNIIKRVFFTVLTSP